MFSAIILLEKEVCTMSENYPSDVKLNENPDGTVSFATEVVATIAGLAATEVDGVASMC